MVRNRIGSAPDNHFAARPLYGVVPSSLGGVDRAGSCPSVCAGIVSPASIQVAVKATSNSTPDDHLGADPDGGVMDSAERRVGRASSCPTVVGWVVPAPSVKKVRVIPSTPNDHFTAGPDRRVCISRSGRVDGARGGPRVGRWVISTARVEVMPDIGRERASPYDHFAAGPDCAVVEARVRHIHRCGGSPSVVCAV
jgi:hypothetical protein